MPPLRSTLLAWGGAVPGRHRGGVSALARRLAVRLLVPLVLGPQQWLPKMAQLGRPGWFGTVPRETGF
jgi:hypothetical protein